MGLNRESIIDGDSEHSSSCSFSLSTETKEFQRNEISFTFLYSSGINSVTKPAE